jgi:antitoxin PrlF
MRITLKITAKGQVTLRKAVLDQLGVRPGDRITIEFVAPGRAEVRPAEAKASIEGFVGSLKDASGPALSIDEMNAIIRDGWAGGR